MELNKEIRKVLIEFAMIVQENNYTNSQVMIRSTYDTFRIQNIVENLFLSGVGCSCTDKEEKAFKEGYELGCKETANDLGSRM